MKVSRADRVPSAVALDFDGVLVDSLDWILRVAGDAADAVGARRPEAGDLRRAQSLAFAPFVAMIGVPPGAEALFGRELGLRMRGEAVAHSLFPGVVEAIREIARSSALVVLTDNLSEVVARSLEPHGLLPLFDAILDASARVPKSERLEGWLGRRGVAPGDAAFVGDTVGDVAEGKKAGVRTVAAAWGYQPEEFLLTAAPDALARSPWELPAAVRIPVPPA